jgi:hypothetical protein
MNRLLIVTSVWACLASPAVAAPYEPSRAIENYRRLMGGLVTWEGLTPSEQDELRELARAIRAQTTPKEDSAKRCWRDEIARYGGDPSELAQRLIDLRCGPRKSIPNEPGTSQPD